MTILEKLRVLQAPAGDAGASGTDAPPPADGGEKPKAEAPPAAATAAGEPKKDGAEAGRKSVLKGSGGDDAAKDGKDGKGDTPGQDAGAKAKDGAADAEYVVTVPEGAKVAPEIMEAFTKAAKETGITAEQASKLVAFQVAQEKAAAEAWVKQSDAWYETLEKDSEFGGKNLKESEAALQRALKRFDPKGEFTKFLEESLLDNRPEVAKFLRRIGLADAEAKTDVITAKDTKPALSKDEIRLAKRFPSIKGIQPPE
jgi:antitoxin component of RelBE/YafQ-DinJ toxin-antitoxin module